MNYAEFYADVVIWIQQANQAAMTHGMGTSEFWLWVSESASVLCQKYNENQLVIRQMTMLVEWMESFDAGRNGGSS